MEARKVVARGLLDADRDPNVTKEEAEDLQDSNPVLIHTHRVRSLFAVSPCQFWRGGYWSRGGHPTPLRESQAQTIGRKARCLPSNSVISHLAAPALVKKLV